MNIISCPECKSIELNIDFYQYVYSEYYDNHSIIETIPNLCKENIVSDKNAIRTKLSCSKCHTVIIYDIPILIYKKALLQNE